MDILKKLPIGIENFEKIRTEEFYYVDKTGLIRELLQNWGEVNLFTRPRRFGKSLNMSMFKYFFENGCDAALFEGLEIMEWFQDEAKKDLSKLDMLCDAFADGDGKAVEEYLGSYLKKTISIRDTSVRKGKKENFHPKGVPSVYHGILLGLLSHREDWGIESNAESGEGYSDILIEIEEKEIGIIIEVKYPESGNLDLGCVKALEQIDRKGYEEKLIEDGMRTILKYGVACWKKRCRVVYDLDETA